MTAVRYGSFLVICTCTFRSKSWTREGAIMMADAHLAECGLEGHAVTVTP